MFATGDTVGLAEWIIDDTCLLFFLLIACIHNFLLAVNSIHFMVGNDITT